MKDHQGMSAHPDDTDVAAYLDGVVDGKRRDTIDAHLAECVECRAGVVLLRESARPMTEEIPAEWLKGARRPPAPPRTDTAWRGRVASGLAAGVVIALGLSLWFSTTTRPGGSRATAYRGPALAFEKLSPSPGDVVAPEGLSFRWSEVAGADRYVVIVTSAAGDPIATIEARAGADAAGWPDDRPRPPAGTLVWKIRAMALDRIIAESRPTSFELR